MKLAELIALLRAVSSASQVIVCALAAFEEAKAINSEDRISMSRIAMLMPERTLDTESYKEGPERRLSRR